VFEAWKACYGHDLATGATATEDEYRATEPAGRPFLRAADYKPAPEAPDDDHPLLLTTGRTVYHFHTRTKTGRSPQLQQAAPDVWVEVNPEDAAGLGLVEKLQRRRPMSLAGELLW
jgi:anaerobic selenocysteine-containing dehydrogenase